MTTNQSTSLLAPDTIYMSAISLKNPAMNVVDSYSNAPPKHKNNLGSTYCWGTVLIGVVVTLVIATLLDNLGTTLGISNSYEVPSALILSATLWAVVTSCTALVIGGLVVFQLLMRKQTAPQFFTLTTFGTTIWRYLFVSTLR